MIANLFILNYIDKAENMRKRVQFFQKKGNMKSNKSKIRKKKLEKNGEKCTKKLRNL